MKNKLSLNSEVSLVEIIFSILIFAIAGIIVLNCFAAARFTQLKANDKVKAGSIVQSNAEMIKYFNNLNEMHEFLSTNFEKESVNDEENIFINFYDKNWNLCDEKDKEYLITIKVNAVPINFGEMRNVDIKAEKAKPYPFIDKLNKNNSIYDITTKKFFSSNKGGW